MQRNNPNLENFLVAEVRMFMCDPGTLYKTRAVYETQINLPTYVVFLKLG